MESNRLTRLTRMFQGITIYHHAMRQYIGKEMRQKVGDKWFSERVINIMERSKR